MEVGRRPIAEPDAVGVRGGPAQKRRTREELRSMGGIGQQPTGDDLARAGGHNRMACLIETKYLDPVGALLVEPGRLRPGGKTHASHAVGPGHSLVDRRIRGIVVGPPPGARSDPVSISLATAEYADGTAGWVEDRRDLRPGSVVCADPLAQIDTRPHVVVQDVLAGPRDDPIGPGGNIDNMDDVVGGGTPGLVRERLVDVVGSVVRDQTPGDRQPAIVSAVVGRS